jgi:hypothetical protein
MTKREVKEIIYCDIGPIVSAKGFKLKRAEDSFERKITDGKQSIGVPVIDYAPKYKISLTLAIRLDAVENIIHLFSGSPTKYHKVSATYISRLDRFVPSEEAVFEVLTEEDIHSICSRWAPIIDNQILPFLDENRDLKSLAQVMNFEKLPETVTGAGPAMHAVTVARLTKDPRFLSLVEGYSERMQYLPKGTQESFLQLVEYLKSEY